MQSYKINTEWLHLMLQIKIAATTSNVHLWIEWYDICGRILATDNFDIRNYNTNTTRSGNHLTLHHHRTVSATHHFYFNQIVRLWYHLLVINVSTPSYVIKQKPKHLWDHFTVNFNSVHFICYIHAIDAQDNHYPPIFSPSIIDTDLQNY